MKLIALALMLSATSAFAGRITEVNPFNDSADLSLQARNVRISGAASTKVVTKFEEVQLHDCSIVTEVPCTISRPLEKKPSVEVTVSYTDHTTQPDEFNVWQYKSFNLDSSRFSEGALALLKRSPKTFVKNHLSLSIEKTSRTVMVVDVENSELCPDYFPGMPDVGCREVLRYKPITVWVQAVKVSVK